MDSFIYNLTKSPVSLWHFIPLGKGAGGSAPYERRNAAAALQQFTFMVAQRLSVCKAVLVSR